MSRRIFYMDRPGTEGVVTDLPSNQLGGRALSAGQDAIKPRGLVRQRSGWAYDGSVADVADNLVTVYRNKFILAAATRTLTGDDDGDLFIHNAAGAGTAIFAGTVEYLARAVYGDELLLCAQDGVTPLRRYGGAGSVPSFSDNDGTYTLNEATITGIAMASPPPSGAYVAVLDPPVGHGVMGIRYRILESLVTSLTLEGVKASQTALALDLELSLTAPAFPAVAVYDAGTITVSSSIVTGYGTKWVDSIAIKNYLDSGGGDAILIIPATGNAQMGTNGANPATNTTAAAEVTNQTTKSNYQITRPCPFKDVAYHKGGLCGTGVKQHKARVYRAPVGWNLSLPPGVTLPFDPTVVVSDPDPLNFLLDFVDVPAPDADDEIVALLSSSNPLIALARADAWGIYGPAGEAPDVSRLPNGEGAGCLDIRSAWELPIGPIWGSYQGVLAYVDGQVVDLTEDRINNEWRTLVERGNFVVGTDYCTIGEAHGVYVVTVTSGSGATKKTWHVYPFDERGRLNPAWYPVSNHVPRFQFSSKVPGESEKLLCVADADQGRVIDYAPAVTAEGIARDGDGTSPALQMSLPGSLPWLAGARVEERILEVLVEANITDAAGVASTLGGTVVSSQRRDSDAAITTNLNSMASKTTNLSKPYKHRVGVRAGSHEIKLAKSATQTTEQLTEIARVGFTQRAGRRPM